MKNIEKFFLSILPLPFTTLGLKFLTFGNNYIPEIFILLWFFLVFCFSYKIKKFIIEILSSKVFLISFSLVLFVSLFSLARQDFDFIAFYGRFRALMACLIGFTIIAFCHKRGWGDELIEYLSIFLFSACLMYFFSSLIGSTSDETKISISMICYALTICLYVEKEKLFLALFITFLSCIVAYLSFFRQNYILALLLLILISFQIIRKSLSFKSSSIHVSKKNAFSFFLLIGLIFSVVSVSSYLYEYLISDESKYIQSIGKINDLIYALQHGGLDESGQLRLKSYSYLFNNLEYYFLPNGLINDNLLYLNSLWGGTNVYLAMSITRDSILAYLLVNFGFLLTFLFLFLFLFNLIYSMSRERRIMIYRIIFIFPSLLGAFFLDGATLTQLQKSLFFGLALGFSMFTVRDSKNVK